MVEVNLTNLRSSNLNARKFYDIKLRGYFCIFYTKIFVFYTKFLNGCKKISVKIIGIKNWCKKAQKKIGVKKQKQMV